MAMNGKSDFKSMFTPHWFHSVPSLATQPVISFPFTPVYPSTSRFRPLSDSPLRKGRKLIAVAETECYAMVTCEIKLF